MKVESAIFIKGDTIEVLGEMLWICDEAIKPFFYENR